MDICGYHWGTKIMELRYELGDTAAPRGHALLYFTQRGARAVLATYVIALPLAIDVARYVPPMFAGRIPTMGGALSAVPIPPIPEQVESRDALVRLATVRHDDLIHAGEIASAAPEVLLELVGEAAQRYTAAYQSYLATVPVTLEPSPKPDLVDVSLTAMTESERIGELSRLVGTLRYATDGHDERLERETRQQMLHVGRLLPAKYRADELLDAASHPGAASAELTQLLVDRCYRLLREEYETLPTLEAEIARLRGQ